MSGTSVAQRWEFRTLPDFRSRCARVGSPTGPRSNSSSQSARASVAGSFRYDRVSAVRPPSSVSALDARLAGASHSTRRRATRPRRWRRPPATAGPRHRSHFRAESDRGSGPLGRHGQNESRSKNSSKLTLALIRSPLRADEGQIAFGIRDGAILMLTDLGISSG